jgi:hypothetical protein
MTEKEMAGMLAHEKECLMISSGTPWVRWFLRTLCWHAFI